MKKNRAQRLHIAKYVSRNPSRPDGRGVFCACVLLKGRSFCESPLANRSGFSKIKDTFENLS